MNGIFVAPKDVTEKGESFQYFIHGYDVPRMFGYAKECALVLIIFLLFTFIFIDVLFYIIYFFIILFSITGIFSISHKDSQTS